MAKNRAGQELGSEFGLERGPGNQAATRQLTSKASTSTAALCHPQPAPKRQEQTRRDRQATRCLKSTFIHSTPSQLGISCITSGRVLPLLWRVKARTCTPGNWRAQSMRAPCFPPPWGPRLRATSSSSSTRRRVGAPTLSACWKAGRRAAAWRARTRDIADLPTVRYRSCSAGSEAMVLCFCTARVTSMLSRRIEGPRTAGSKAPRVSDTFSTCTHHGSQSVGWPLLGGLLA